MRLCYALFLRIKLSNANRLFGLKVVRESFFEIPISSLILRSYWESLLCDYSIVVDYILEINLTDRKKI